MKSEGKIRHKFKQAKFRHFQRRLRGLASRAPGNCKYNETYTCANKTIGLCRFREIEQENSWSVVVCDGETEEGFEQAQSCPVFSPLQSEQEIKDEIDEILSTKDIAVIAYHFPDLAALLWVLGDFEGVDAWLEEKTGEKDAQDPESDIENPGEDALPPDSDGVEEARGTGPAAEALD